MCNLYEVVNKDNLNSTIMKALQAFIAVGDTLL